MGCGSWIRKPAISSQLNWLSAGGDDPELHQPLSAAASPPAPDMRRHWNWWMTVCVNTALLVVGQTAATLLGRFYYDQGGSSKWLQTLTFSAGFPVLYIPLLLTPRPPPPAGARPPVLKLWAIYIAIGVITAADSLMYSCGLMYISVSTYSLVCATQLGFNAVFSYLINGEKFTLFALNSVVLLTFSAVIIGIHTEGDGPTVLTGGRYVLGFALTLGASALYSLILSLMELTFDKVMKSQTFHAVYDMQINTALVSTIAAVVGLFASGEWKGLGEDMEGFHRGKAGYIMTLVFASVSWQVTNVGLVGLIFEVSSLFSNVMSTMGIPMVPIFAVILFHDRMGGMKVLSLLLAIWGLISYFYQHYIDYIEEKKAKMIADDGEEGFMAV